jgi:hypothetical protein
MNPNNPADEESAEARYSVTLSELPPLPDGFTPIWLIEVMNREWSTRQRYYFGESKPAADLRGLPRGLAPTGWDLSAGQFGGDPGQTREARGPDPLDHRQDRAGT